ncbi:unknown [Ruminococcus sp. CAG:579]|nr:unknown [Ruminococcus sp. CAG:579]
MCFDSISFTERSHASKKFARGLSWLINGTSESDMK